MHRQSKIEELTKRIESILGKVLTLKKAYVVEQLGQVDYLMIFPKNEKDRLELVEVAKTIGGKIVFSDDMGDVFYFEECVKTFFSDVNLLKIGNYKPQEKRVGYADFRPVDYGNLKIKYSKKNNFVYITGEGWELIGVEDPVYDVSFYIPNIPLSNDLNIS